MNTHQTKQFILGWNMGVEKANHDQIASNLVLFHAVVILSIAAIFACYLMVRAENNR